MEITVTSTKMGFVVIYKDIKVHFDSIIQAQSFVIKLLQEIGKVGY